MKTTIREEIERIGRKDVPLFPPFPDGSIMNKIWHRAMAHVELFCENMKILLDELFTDEGEPPCGT